MKRGIVLLMLLITIGTHAETPPFQKVQKKAKVEQAKNFLIDEFSAPSIEVIFDDLDQLAPLPIKETRRVLPEKMPLDRADLAIEIGYLIAEGFLEVQNESLTGFEEVVKKLSRYGKALGAGDRITQHAASLILYAKKNDTQKLKEELILTQKDVELELTALDDVDLAYLISLSGWIRALECASVAVMNDFTEERANQLFRDTMPEYYEKALSLLDPRLAKRESFIQMRILCVDLGKAMSLAADEEPTEQKGNLIKRYAKEMGDLILTRAQ